MEVGNKKAGYIDADFYNVNGPVTYLELPSKSLLENKIDFFW